MATEFKELYNRSKIENYIEGNYKKNICTDEQIKNKRIYFENLQLCDALEFTKERWLNEIKREFELNKNFKEFPDASFPSQKGLLSLDFNDNSDKLLNLLY